MIAMAAMSRTFVGLLAISAVACGTGKLVAPGGDAAPSCADLVVNTSAARQPAASIHVTQSTNTSAIDVVAFDDGSAERTLGASRDGGTTGLDPAPKSYPPLSPEVLAFLCDLRAVGDVSAIPADPGRPYPTLPGCAKSVSFGTVTTVSAGGKTSGDLQCLDNPSAAATALAHDADVLTGSP